MQKLKVDFITSLDGYGAGEGWPGFWGLEVPEYLDLLRQEEPHTALLGATTYRLMSQFTDDGSEAGLAEVTATPKVVFSSTLEEPLGWANTRLVRGDVVEAVRQLKQDSSRPLHTLGSVTLARSLLLAGLVDRFRVVVFPVITGATGQDRIYDNYPDVALELVDHRTLDGQLQLLEYVPTVLDGPPATG